MLQDAVGRSEACPEAGCPFWEQGGAVLDGGCFLERILPFEDWTPELARRWLRVRAQLEGEADGWPPFYLLGGRTAAASR